MAENAADIQEAGLNYPGILCLHIIVRTHDTEAEKPWVILGQRSKKGQDGHYYPGRWSASFEEQIKPYETIEVAVERGLEKILPFKR